ncbi:MAG: aldo/keto reductase [Porticoccaceae bacterium]|nr:aldo/keto reductase [Porticoccaceae bacterium]
MTPIINQTSKIPVLGFGTFRMPEPDTLRMVTHVLKNGYDHIDTAQIYENEAAVGSAIQASGRARSDIFLTTKVWVDNFHSSKFIPSVEESLKKLKTDYVDLLLLHWPNEAVPLADQIGLLNQVHKAGMARHIGVSNYTLALFDKAWQLSDAPLVTNQIEYHPYLDQHRLLEQCRKVGQCITAYYAMADGKVLEDAVLKDIAANHGKTVAQVVLRWLVQQPAVVALSKTVSEERADMNRAIFDFSLDESEMKAIHGLANADGRIISPPGLAPVWD